MSHELKYYESDGVCVSYIESGAGAPTIHFAHANGFNAAVYAPIIGELSRGHRVLGMNFCGQCHCGKSDCGGERGIDNWHRLEKQLSGFLRGTAGGARVVGVGHSIGGVVTMFSAVRYPELFDKIILLDPVLLAPKLVRLIRVMNLLKQRRRAPLAVRARKRRNGWADRADAFEYFRARPLFDGWDEAALRAYVDHGLIDTPGGGGVTLSCPPEVEAQGFESYPVDIWRRVRELRVPVLFVRGENSDVITPAARDLFLRLQPRAEYIELTGAGHLFPMLRTAETARIIRDFAG